MNLCRPLKSCFLYGILDRAYLGRRDPAEVARQMIAGGVDILQIRAKNTSPEWIREIALAVRDVTRPASVPLIINDYPDIALEVDADGVHLGQEDIPTDEARRIVGPACWIGRSTHSPEQARQAVEERVDYIGVGPVFATPTKPTYVPVGTDLVREVASWGETTPFFAIGGIKLSNVASVLEAGATRVVVVSGILEAPRMIDYCRELKKNLLYL